MTDKELLELAAKAAGVELKWSRPYKILWDFSEVPDWNPLTDDGDALRLAVKLRLDVMTDCYNACCIQVGKDNWITENTGDDSYEEVLIATRRAIVRAAAAVGEML